MRGSGSVRGGAGTGGTREPESTGGADFVAFARTVTPPLFRTAVLLAGDFHLAEDLVQDCLARLYRAWPIHADSPIAYARAVIVLRYLADRSVEQVAADLGRSPGAIRVQAMRALAKLRVLLAESQLDLVEP